jgi:cytochrome c oxidase subunit 2
VGLTGAARLTQADPVEDGKKIVEAKKCSICHAHEGKGGKTGKPMAELAADRSDDFLKGSLLDPKKTIAADTKMPSYQGKLTDDEVAAVIAYMKSLKK